MNIIKKSWSIVYNLDTIIWNILVSCSKDPDCPGYQICHKYLNSADGYCHGKPCKEGTDDIIMDTKIVTFLYHIFAKFLMVHMITYQFKSTEYKAKKMRDICLAYGAECDRTNEDDWRCVIRTCSTSKPCFFSHQCQSIGT